MKVNCHTKYIICRDFKFHILKVWLGNLSLVSIPLIILKIFYLHNKCFLQIKKIELSFNMYVILLKTTKYLLLMLQYFNTLYKWSFNKLKASFHWSLQVNKGSVTLNSIFQAINYWTCIWPGQLSKWFVSMPGCKFAHYKFYRKT